MGTPLPLAKAALVHLGEIWPASIALEELIAAASARLQAAGAAAPERSQLQRLQDNLLQCVLGEVVELHSGPDAFVSTGQPHDRSAAPWPAGNRRGAR